MNKFIIYLLLVVLAGVGVQQYLKYTQKQPEVTVSTTPTATPVPTEEQFKDALLASDQKPGKSLTVAMATLAAPGYVVIHADSSGQPGTIIGQSALLPKGVSQNVPVTVTSALVNKKKYFAMLHADNGDGVYKSADDLPVKDAAGNPVMVQFLASTTAATASPTPATSVSPSAAVSPSESPAATTKNVSIIDFTFLPATLTVKKGEQVVFTNNDSTPHTATGDFGDSGNLNKNQTFTLNTANLQPGTYKYHCTYHPNMTGTLVVQ